MEQHILKGEIINAIIKAKTTVIIPNSAEAWLARISICLVPLSNWTVTCLTLLVSFSPKDVWYRLSSKTVKVPFLLVGILEDILGSSTVNAPFVWDQIFTQCCIILLYTNAFEYITAAGNMINDWIILTHKLSVGYASVSSFTCQRVRIGWWNPDTWALTAVNFSY